MSSTCFELGFVMALKMGEVKAQKIRCDEGAGLLHVLAQDVSQGPVQQMRGRVVRAVRFLSSRSVCWV